MSHAEPSPPRRKLPGELWIVGFLWALGVVTLVVIVFWTGWISFSVLSVWWARLTGN